jgi:hypothetical protein
MTIPSATAGVPYSWRLYAVHGAPPGATVTWGLTGGALPPGLQVGADKPNGLTASLYGTPSQTGTYSFTLAVDNASASPQSYILTVWPKQTGPTL